MTDWQNDCECIFDGLHDCHGLFQEFVLELECMDCGIP
jgi:hypothetical protein